MLALDTIIYLLIFHFIGDFILQSDKIATTKSKSNKSLLTHIGLYSLAMLPFGLVFAVVNGIIHFAVDYVTSRVSSKLWADGKIHWFFVTIGFDQMLHAITLFSTYAWLN